MAIGICDYLTELNLAYNELSEIRPEVGKLIHIEKLIFTKNKIKKSQKKKYKNI
jgi:hypothetical protein